MAVDFSLMVEDNTLQEYLVDKTTGGPLSGGIITFYVDSPRSPLTLKHIYYLTGIPGAYTFSLLPNPLTLSSVGTVVDPAGNDTKIFYYLYNESATIPTTQPQSYYVTVVNSGLVPQFTRQNFPFLPPASGGGVGVANIQNIVTNNEFWRNGGRSSDGLVTLNGLSTTNVVDPGTSLSVTTIAPSQHDGYSMQDILFVKNTVDGTDTLSFLKFSGIVLTGDITPEYYINYTCSVAGTETVKYIQIPLSLHIQTLLSEPNCVLTIQGEGVGTITLDILAYAGSGAATVLPATVKTQALTTTWTKIITVPFTMPSPGTPLGGGGDDAYYLQIGLPTAQTCSINIAKPSFYLSDDPTNPTLPTNDFQTYDQINSIISSPRIGDIRTSINSFAPYGWVLLNDTTIGSFASTAITHDVSTWPLYNLLYNSVNDAFATVSGGRTGSAINDFDANKTMTLPLALGRVLMGLPPAFNVTSYTSGSAPTWNSGTNGFFTLINTALLYVGAPVILTGIALNAAFTSGNLYYAIPAIDGSTTQLQLATSYANAVAGIAIAASGGASGTSIVLTISLGGIIGQAKHTQLGIEVGVHLHTAPIGIADTTLATNLFGAGDMPTTGTASTNVSPGTTVPMNIIQPSLYLNVFMKL